MKTKYLLCLLTGIVFPLSTNAQIIDTIGNTVVKIDSLVGFTNDAHNWPWDLYWGPDNKLWYTVGNSICRYDTSLGTIDTLFSRPGPPCNAMSVTVHPDFLTYPYVYVTYDIGNYYYSYSAGPIVLFRYSYSATADSLDNEMELLRWNHAGEHAGGRIITGIDDYIYITTSEYSFSADTPGNINGRILRINPDGTVPLINTSGNYDISYGHRNPQGIVQVPSGNIIISELGQTIDELNLIFGYNNYGWPAYDGDQCYFTDSCLSSTYVYQSPIDTAIRPPSGIDYYDHPAIPELQGCILQSILSFGGSQGGMVASKLDSVMMDVVSDVHYFKGEYLRWRDVCVTNDGKIFAITNDRSIPVIRVIYNPDYETGIEGFENVKFELYPNPGNDMINIQSTKSIGNWEIVSGDGKVMKSGTNVSNLFQVQLESLAPGLYFFKTKFGNKKLIVQ
jgi:hypothetical protein